ncbi:MAG: LysR family transcriptional regulator [Burkholderiales bacterium PBB6]|nr:MAG: LysR family transcriptional regulator [Burkholderiales bacterium PBB6]
MDMRSIDLNLLVAFDAMCQHQSVTRAGEAIGLSQPAMSAAVARLRALFNDPLFVKVGTVMQPTERAQALAEAVRRVMVTVQQEILQPSGFTPETSDRTFTVITPDIGEMHFLPLLLAHLAKAAPGVRLNAVSRNREAAGETLAGADADLALGYFPDLKGSAFFQQKLFDNKHVCLLRRDHPQLRKGSLTLKAYLALQHVVVHPDGREHVFERHLQQTGHKRDVRLELSHFMSLMPIIESTDLVATVPRDLAAICQRYTQVEIVACPIACPVIPVHQFWHRRSHKDAASIWLRAQVAQLFKAG